MSEKNKFLLRSSAGDQCVELEHEINDWIRKGQAKLGDFIFDFSLKKWFRLGDHPLFASLVPKPTQQPEKKLIYFMSPSSSAAQGPFSLNEMNQRAASKELSESSWVFVEGDKEWRQIKQVKALNDFLPQVPADMPSQSDIFSSSKSGEIEISSASSELSLSLEANDNADPAFANIEKEDETKAFSALGLALDPEMQPIKKTEAVAPKTPTVPPLPKAAVPKPPSLPNIPKATIATPPPQGADRDQGSFDGLTAEIPADPIWLVKPANSEVVSGPFKFLDIVKFLEQGKISKNDKISKTGSNRFVKIQQQYEFNVKYSVETVIERGVEKQKILIRRRHPRVPYIADVQITSKQGLLNGACANISAGGILMEMSKADFNLGDILEIKILPGFIPKSISCKAMVIGKIPKMPPAFALKFEELKNEDKEAIEYFVQEALKRELP